MRYDHIERYQGLFTDPTELRIQENRSLRISLINGDATQNLRVSTGGVSSRVFKDGVWGFASHPVVSDEKVAQVVKRATENARFLASREGRPGLALPTTHSTASRDLSTTKRRWEQKELLDFAQAVDAYCQATFPGLQSRTISVQELTMEKTVLTSDGSQVHSLIPRAMLYLALQVEKNGETFELYEGFGGLGQWEDRFSDPQLLAPQFDQLYQRLRQKAEGVYARPGVHDVVLGADLAGILAHEAVGHTVEADLVLGGSVAGDRLGQPVASPLVTLVDFAHTALGQTCPVPLWTDDEGTPGQDAVLIDRGVLKGFLHNKDSARHFGVAPTGNARAYQFFDEPLIRMRNTAILPGTSRLDEMIAGVDEGYYFLQPSNGQADSTGEFTFGVTLGYEIRGGKLGRAVRDTTISGVAFDMLKTVTQVSDDMVWSCGGMCGKKQMIPVGMGGPALRCRVAVGGR